MHKKSRELFFIPMLVCLSVMLGCHKGYFSTSFQKVEPERTKLIAGIESYQSAEEFKSSLAHSALQQDVVDEGESSSPAGRPPFKFRTLAIKKFSHLGVQGDLFVTFFNNRLMETQFYPSDAGSYITAVEKKEGLHFGEHKEIALPPHTLIRVAVDGKGKTYINWMDNRLYEEVDLWIMKYS